MGLLDWLHRRSLSKRFDSHLEEQKRRREEREEADYQEWLKKPTCCRCGSTDSVFQKSLGDSGTQRYWGRREAYCWRCDPYRGILDPRMWADWESYPYKDHYIRTKEEFEAVKRQEKSE
jgi:hypothetical protein